MTDLLSKLTSYNLFNYLLPGTVFVVLAEHFTQHSFVQDDALLAFFVYYFIGLVISRIGSLAIEPVLKKSKLVRLAPYQDYVRRSVEDPKIEVLSEANNTYRTLLATVVAVGVLRVSDWASQSLGISVDRDSALLLLGLAVLFVLSYRKQSDYVRSRVTRE